MTKDISYSGDRFEWFDKQIKALKNKDKDSLDLDDLVRNLESSKNDMQEDIKKWVKALIKGKYKLARRAYIDAESLYHAAHTSYHHLLSYLNRFPSIEKYIEENLPIYFEEGLNEVGRETSLVQLIFPKKCDFSLDKLLQYWADELSRNLYELNKVREVSPLIWIDWRILK